MPLEPIPIPDVDLLSREQRIPMIKVNGLTLLDIIERLNRRSFGENGRTVIEHSTNETCLHLGSIFGCKVIVDHYVSDNQILIIPGQDPHVYEVETINYIRNKLIQVLGIMDFEKQEKEEEDRREQKEQWQRRMMG